MNLINGRALAQKIKERLKNKLEKTDPKPGLGVILVGNDPASHLYVSLKEKACQEVGIKFEKFIYSNRIKQEKILKTINELNNRSDIHGILIQLPLPSGYKTNTIISKMDPQKDVDGFHSLNTQSLLKGKILVEPVLAKAIWALIKKVLLKKYIGEKTLIIANSSEFMQPLQAYLKINQLNVDVLNFKQIKKYRTSIKKYKIVIIAVGSANFFKSTDFQDGAIIIDVGINKLPDNKITGDVDISTFVKKKAWITPVPGGVGPVTVAMLLDNVYFLYLRNKNHRTRL